MNNLQLFEIVQRLMTNDIHNENELKILKAIICHLDELEQMDIAMLARQAGVSKSSVTRFVQRFEDTTFKSFIYYLNQSYNDLSYAKSFHTTQLETKDLKGIMQGNVMGMVENIKLTYNDHFEDKIDKIYQQISQAKSVTFIGGKPSTNMFIDVQKLLIENNIPCYIYNQTSKLEVHLNNLEKDELVILIILSEYDYQYVGKYYLDILEKQNNPFIVLCQPRVLSLENVIYYGSPTDSFMGNASLHLIAEGLMAVIQKNRL